MASKPDNTKKKMVCPLCAVPLSRAHRKPHQRLLLFSRRYYCGNCYRHYFRWLNIFKEEGFL